MAAHSGIKTPKENLVLQLDPSNPKSFAGEPTVNLFTSTDLMVGYGFDASGFATLGTRTLQSDGSILIQDTNSNGRLGITLPASLNIPYTISIKYKKQYGVPTFRFQISGTGSSGTPTLQSWWPSITGSQPQDINGWQTVYYTYTFTTAGITKQYIYFQDGADYTGYTHSYFLKEPQLEQKDHVTPFVNGTRSATGGLKDLSGNANHGTLVNNPIASSSNKGILIYNSGAVTTINVNSWIRTVRQISMSGWYYHVGDTNGAPWGIMTSLTPGSDDDGFWWHIKYGGTTLYLRTEDAVSGESGYTGAPFVTTNNWYHIVTIVGASKFIIYVNGVLYLDWTTNVPFSWANISSNTAYATIGTSYGVSANCKIASVQLYKRALTAKEISQDYNMTRGRFLN